MGQFVKISDQYTYVFSLRLRNKVLIYCLSIGQLVVATFSLAQHFVSVMQFDEIFKCSFNESIHGCSDPGRRFLSYDIIIFDFRLFHGLIKVANDKERGIVVYENGEGKRNLIFYAADFDVEECIANYLDGGYMRCLWCIGQIVALITALFSMLLIPKAHPLYLSPLLVVQNAYCFGLIILTIATADKLLTSILHPVNGHLIILIIIFFIGTLANHLFNYILWHYYWYQESEYIKRTGLPVIPFWP